MNVAHSTHNSQAPDPGIRHVLRGWNPNGPEPVRHELQVDDVMIRNVTTNIRDWGGSTRFDRNSIFLFQIGDVCIAHLGHLHHTLRREHLAEIGRVDVLLVPVDGSFTLDLDGMKEVLGVLGASVMVPMHFFSPATLDRFLDRVRGEFPIREHDSPAIILSKATLPREPTVIVMPGLHPRYDWRGRR
jgi:L-ascorbate metabolism protein UlaG (beta-lactamase superfamily)